MFTLLSGRKEKELLGNCVGIFFLANPNLLLMLGEIWRESCSLGRKDTKKFDFLLFIFSPLSFYRKTMENNVVFHIFILFVSLFKFLL